MKKRVRVAKEEFQKAFYHFWLNQSESIELEAEVIEDEKCVHKNVFHSSKNGGLYSNCKIEIVTPQVIKEKCEHKNVFHSSTNGWMCSDCKVEIVNTPHIIKEIKEKCEHDWINVLCCESGNNTFIIRCDKCDLAKPSYRLLAPALFKSKLTNRVMISTALYSCKEEAIKDNLQVMEVIWPARIDPETGMYIVPEDK